jgi:hypothetical protein
VEGICLLASPFAGWLLLKDSEATEETRFKLQ